MVWTHLEQKSSRITPIRSWKESCFFLVLLSLFHFPKLLLWLNMCSTDKLATAVCTTYHGLIRINGIGTQVKKTVRRRKDFLPQASERAPISGALRKDKKPCDRRKTINTSVSTFPRLTLSTIHERKIENWFAIKHRSCR